MPWRCAFDLVTTVSSLRGRDCASLKAKRMMRSTPARGHGAHVGDFHRMALVGAAADAGVLASEFSRTITQSRSLGVQRFSGASMPGRMRVGRTLAYWSKPWQIFRRRPWRDVVRDVRVAGRAEQDGVLVAQRLEAVGRHHLAVGAVPVAAPAEAGEGEVEAGAAGGQRLQHLLPGRNDFLADAVAGMQAIL